MIKRNYLHVGNVQFCVRTCWSATTKKTAKNMLTVRLMVRDCAVGTRRLTKILSSVSVGNLEFRGDWRALSILGIGKIR